MTYILASGSPRRREMLSHLGLDFRVCVADADETSDERDGAALVELLSARKAQAVRDRLTRAGEWNGETVIIAADTVVVDSSGEILGKPRDEADAARMLRALSGNTHRVISGVAVMLGERLATSHEVTEVTFSHLSDALIARYIASGEPMDKAGAYGIQDTAALWISGIKGDYFNVVGLPVHRLEMLLQQNFGLSLWKNG
ncbi:MAG: septum formation protein Maf [Clostridia bacterium]|nr:septum formation protein Maf [Clostridia bacterium]